MSADESIQFNIADLKELQLDALKEIGNIGAGNAATALSKMVSKKVDMTVPRANVLGLNEVPDIVGGAEALVVGIYLTVEGDAPGHIMFIIPLASARALIDMLMGSQGSASTEFTEMEWSALKEIGNILSSSYLGALTGMSGLFLAPSPPSAAMDMAGAILSVILTELAMVGDVALVIETEFLNEVDSITGYFFLIPDPGSLNALLKAIGVLDV